MQYMILMGYKVDGVPPITTWDPEDVTRHIEFQNALGRELSEAGELVGGNGLAGPEDAKIVVSDGTGAPAVTDGPFPESKEFLAGYWMVDVESEARGDRDRRQGVGGARARGPPARAPDGGARGAPGARDRGVVTRDPVTRRRGPAARARAAGPRRAGAAVGRLRGRPRTRCRKRCSPRSGSGRPTACPRTRAAGSSRSRAGG